MFNELYCFSVPENLFINKNGDPLSAHGVEEVIDKVVQRASLKANL